MADTGLLIIDTAITALAEAASTDEVLKLRGDAERAKAYAKIAKNRTMQADAAVIIQRAERRLGQMIQSAKETGQLGIGRRSKSNVSVPERAAEEMVGADDHSLDVGEQAAPDRFSLEEIGVTKDLSSRAQKWARLGETDFEANLAALRERIVSGGAKLAKGQNRATMASRSEPDDSLDYFPTPPWATRTLIVDVLGHHGVMLFDQVLADPCSGEGHISGVLEEVHEAHVIASDIFDHSRDGVSPPGWLGAADYLDPTVVPAGWEDGGRVDWIITNPPFGGRELQFVLKALDEARVGVAVFVRSQWAVEGVERYEQLFRDRPPTIEAYFTERVPLVKGRWDPEAASMTAYCWLVWIKGEAPRPLFRIPPGRRVARSRPDDVARFTARPVRSLFSIGEGGAATLADALPAPSGNEGGSAGRLHSSCYLPSESTAGVPDGPVAAEDLKGELPVAGAVGRSPEQNDALAAPSSPAALSDIAKNAIIERAYATEPFPGVAAIAAQTGLTLNAVRLRAKKHGWSNRDRQRDAVRAANRRRAERQAAE